MILTLKGTYSKTHTHTSFFLSLKLWFLDTTSYRNIFIANWLQNNFKEVINYNIHRYLLYFIIFSFGNFWWHFVDWSKILFFLFLKWYIGRPIFADIPTYLVRLCPILLEIPTYPKTGRPLWTFSKAINKLIWPSIWF